MSAYASCEVHDCSLHVGMVLGWCDCVYTVRQWFCKCSIIGYSITPVSSTRYTNGWRPKTIRA